MKPRGRHQEAPLHVRRAKGAPSSLRGGISRCVSSSLHDSRIPRSWPRSGPFQTIQDLDFWLRGDLRLEEHAERNDDQNWKEIEDMVALWLAPVFTHGDVNPFNILVCGNRATGIIDWEFAGWYPHYWEYTSAWSWAQM
ncbi:hypothetical protein N657DRAFT_708637 [Parathielavia appendiculata]|uniref:Aminoglycoside phosphotransferase domain-containing protein n=1 Tax=Parathielavia appendiculata TaxID=2587402 RepID=A0AAN6U3E7_9PEZI|nr:hypothetical protein N657DRAFT_708637 [Parathielavia appendiculata]